MFSLLTKENSEFIFSKKTKQKETIKIYFTAPNNPPNSLFKNPKKRILATFVNAFPATEILTRIMIKVKAKEKIFIYDSSIDSSWFGKVLLIKSNVKLENFKDPYIPRIKAKIEVNSIIRPLEKPL